MQNYKSLIKLYSSRETDDSFRIRYQRSMHVTDDLIDRMELDAELQGHQGCVNCLDWNNAGNLLASGSDDLHVIVWDPFRKKIIQNIKSGHTGNIFSVKFAMNDANILSGSAGFEIRMHDIETKDISFLCACHEGRVKRLAVTPNEPFMFWSCAEDGFIMEYDLRDQHRCQAHVCNNALIHLNHPLGRRVEAKCIAINASKPELLAVGANDPYVRLYDRRMIKPPIPRYTSRGRIVFPPNEIFINQSLEPGDDKILPDAVSYFVAAHIPHYQDGDYMHRRTLNVTYLAFSPDGNELLANLGGEHIYLFNIKNKRRQMVLNLMDLCKPICMSSTEDGVVSQNGPYFEKGNQNDLIMSLYEHDCSPYTWSSPSEKTKYERLKLKADELMDQEYFCEAIDAYTTAIYHFPKIASLYANRASALIKREWDGDLYAAVRDCYTALNLIPNYVNAHYRLCFAFIRLHWHRESLHCLTVMKEKYPNEITKAKFKDLKEYFNLKFPTSEHSDSNGHTSSSGDRTYYVDAGDIQEQEQIWRALAYDYETRYIGHCNTTTDIKEANFFGSNGQYIVAGSDDSSFYIWDKCSTKILKVVRGDGSIVNCVQPHPITCLLATSGIDPVIRLWLPIAEKCKMEETDVRCIEDAALANQKRMRTDPLEVMLLNIMHLSRN
ncbi:hypothetical protein JTE90_021667 [Oedothorax gibbosus]|uniref:WD and tetratricopeptide repeats protein 1 n=1 Tax=Oedothorax gibbosus TaxID=931172 RepID=A0AAV6VQU6_9ARAC|nr:hypothetical protein JTE90_021667 [Oedothorax gibbosus]